MSSGRSSRRGFGGECHKCNRPLGIVDGRECAPQAAGNRRDNCRFSSKQMRKRGNGAVIIMRYAGDETMLHPTKSRAGVQQLFFASRQILGGRRHRLPLRGISDYRQHVAVFVLLLEVGDLVVERDDEPVGAGLPVSESNPPKTSSSTSSLVELSAVRLAAHCWAINSRSL